jgi:hypothetical protein
MMLQVLIQSYTLKVNYPGYNGKGSSENIMSM